MTPYNHTSTKKTYLKKDATKAKIKAPHRRNIPSGISTAERHKRSTQIKKALKPIQGKYIVNQHTGDKIYITKDGIKETAHHASNRYRSTLAALDTPRQLKTAKTMYIDNADQTKSTVKKMRIRKKHIAQSKHSGTKTKVIIGEQANGEKILYSITSSQKRDKKKKR